MTALHEPATATLARLAPGDARWRDYVDAHPDALVFHHPAWLQLIQDAYGFRPFVLGLDDGYGGLAGGLPVAEIRGRLRGRRWVALPFSDHCPPLGLDGVPLAELLTEARVRAGVVRLDVHAELQGPGSYPAAEAVRHVLPLQADAAEVRKTFHRSQVQRSIKKAEKAGVVVRRATAAADVTDVYYRLHTDTRHRLGVPVQPRRFFHLLWKRVLEPGLGFVLIAEADGVPVAGAVFLAYGETVIYKYGASRASAWGLRPNHAIFWDAIRWSCETGHRWFDFGRSDLEHTSLRQFKSGWGSEELPLRYTTLAAAPARAGAGRAGKALAPILRRSPRWVCRGLGELLYRYAA